VGEIDHLVYATPDLDVTVEALAALLGVRAVPGGRHPGRGTRNALLGLGGRCYLEVVGPDEDQAAPAEGRWFSIDHLDRARLVAWAVRDPDLDARSAEAVAAHLSLGPIVSGSRQRPDGERLSWRFTDPAVLAAGGVVPFLIDWGTGPHPADTLPQHVRLVELRAEHPDASRVQAFLRQLGVDVSVGPGERPRLAATLDTPRGRVDL
jgi:Glyoxalase-like domain